MDNRDSLPLTRIRPTTGFFSIDFSQLWEYRELLYFLAWRDIKVRYKQTAIGVVWALLQPLSMMLIFTLFFGKLAKVPSGNVPYALFSFVALLPWQVFSRTVSESTNSLVTDQRLITRVFFPRVLVPTAVSLAALMDFGISILLLIPLMFYYGVVPGPEILWLPLFTALLLMTALGIGFWLSALNVEYRDVMYTIPFLNQFLLFISPVVYPSSMVPEKWRILYGINPMAGVIEGFRWCLLGTGQGPSVMFWVSVLVSFFLFISGLVWFRNRERTMADFLGSQ
jgi:lipopolysaccharide transport system permease protein